MATNIFHIARIPLGHPPCRAHIGDKCKVSRVITGPLTGWSQRHWSAEPRGIAISVSVCLSVCPLSCPRNHISKLRLILLGARSFSDDSAISLRTSGFVDDVMFSHNGVNGTESKTALCLIEFAKWRHRTAAASRVPEAKSAIFDCLVHVCLLQLLPIMRHMSRTEASDDIRRFRKVI